jgi:hypothetical protein
LRDLDFISGDFFDMDLPVEKRYLLRYFTTPHQKLYLRYCMVFGDAKLFMEHTGVRRSKRWLFAVKALLKGVQEAHRLAKFNFDFELLTAIESGENVQYKPVWKKKETNA